MVKYETLDRAFGALADPTRRAIVERLSSGEATVREIAGPFAMSLPAVLKHIGVLERAGMVRCAKSGRTKRCALDARAFEQAASWIDERTQTWERRLRALGTVLEEDT